MVTGIGAIFNFLPLKEEVVVMEEKKETEAEAVVSKWLTWTTIATRAPQRWATDARREIEMRSLYYYYTTILLYHLATKCH